VRIAQFYFLENERDEWSDQCDPTRPCGMIFNAAGAVERHVRACSVSEVVRFPGTVDIPFHGCRASNLGNTRACVGLSSDP
jgi:hypothetical protein